MRRRASSDADPNADGNSDSDANAVGNSDTDTNSDAYTNGDAHSDAYTNPDGYAYTAVRTVYAYVDDHGSKSRCLDGIRFDHVRCGKRYRRHWDQFVPRIAEPHARFGIERERDDTGIHTGNL